MYLLQRKAAHGQRQVSTLRQRLRVLFLIVITLLALLLVDAVIPARAQPSAWLAVKIINVYQWMGRPVTRKYVVCRFRPTCSDYAKQAIGTHGFWLGSWMAVDRLRRCNSGTPLGTYDSPVP